MHVVVTLMYLTAMALSFWGVYGPLRKARLLAAKAERAKKLDHRLYVRACKEADLYEKRDPTLDEEVEAKHPLEIYREAVEQPFEGGPETIASLAQAWVMKGGSRAKDAHEDAENRAEGLRFVAWGIAMGCIASILSVWWL